jgi:hypothetical protein
VKLKVGLYGVLFHAVIVSFFFGARSSGDDNPPLFYLIAAPLVLVSAFIVYFFFLSSYVQKREGMQRVIVFDSLAGMLGEYMIFTLAAVLYSLFVGLQALAREGAGAFINAVATGLFVNLLFVYAKYMVHMLVIGNIAGLAGWFILKQWGLKKR